MASQTITIQLPEQVYGDVAKRAHHSHRSVEDEVVAVITEALPTIDDLPTELADELEQLRLLSDTELWQAARITVGEEDTERMQTLVSKQQRNGLTENEQNEAEQLVDYYNHTMLVRAQAAVLLKERGFNISSLIASPSE